MERDAQPQPEDMQDTMPSGMDSDDQQSTDSALDKIAAAMELMVGNQPDTPENPGRKPGA